MIRISKQTTRKKLNSTLMMARGEELQFQCDDDDNEEDLRIESRVQFD